MSIEIDGSTSSSERTICLLLLFEDANAACTPSTLASQISSSYTYTIGDAAISIPQLFSDGCGLTCSLTLTPPITGVITNNFGTSYDIQTDDVSIVPAGAS